MPRSVALLLVVATLAAGEVTGEPLLDRLHAASQALPSLRVAFTQSKLLALFDEPVVTRGVIEIDRRIGALRWEFTGHSVTVLKDGRLRRWGAEGREEAAAERDPGMPAMLGQMRALLSGDWRTVQDLFTLTADPAGASALTLVPKDAAIARYIARITVRFRADLAAPESLRLEAAGGDATDYTFAVPEPGALIAATRFERP